MYNIIIDQICEIVPTSPKQMNNFLTKFTKASNHYLSTSLLNTSDRENFCRDVPRILSAYNYVIRIWTLDSNLHSCQYEQKKSVDENAKKLNKLMDDINTTNYIRAN